MIKPTTLVHAVYHSGVENNYTMLNSELYTQFLYDTGDITTACFVIMLAILVLLDNGCIFCILTNHFYDMNEILYNCLPTPAHDMNDS